MLGLISKVDFLVQQFKRSGHQIAGAVDLPVLKHQLSQVKHEFETGWMLPSEENIRVSKLQIDNGEFVTL